MRRNKKLLPAWVYAFLGPALIIILVLLDQGTKLWALRHLKDQTDLVLIPGVLELNYLENRGMAFGLFQGKRLMLVFLCAVFFAAFLYFYKKVPKTRYYLPLILISLCMFAGALGNFIDRTIRGFVVDFIYFSLIDFPIFNLADVYVVCSGIFLVLLTLLKYKNDDDFNFLKIQRNPKESV